MAHAGQQGSSQRPGEAARRDQGIGGQRSDPELHKTENIMSAMSERIQDVASGAKETVEEWGSAAAEAAGQAKHKAQEFASSAAHKAEHFGEDLTGLIRRYPLQSLAVGFGVGFMLAQVMRR